MDWIWLVPIGSVGIVAVICVLAWLETRRDGRP